MKVNYISVWKCAYKWQLAINSVLTKTPLVCLVLCPYFAYFSYPATIGKHCPALTFLNMQGKLNSIDNAPLPVKFAQSLREVILLAKSRHYNSSVPTTQCICFFFIE